ncbi:integrase, catalytic region, zinc finger, CCHC-type containing protein [Tanacetum coccineum]
MLIFSKSLFFLWAEAVATACYTQNCALIHPRYNKTPYELLRDRKPELKYLHVFGALCYLTNNFEDLGKLQPNADIGIFTSVVSITISIATLPPPDTARASSSTTIDRDDPSPSTSPNNDSTSPLINSTNVEEPNNEEEAER